MFERVAPILFVLIWSTGWIVGKFVAVIGADPITFLSLRYACALVVVVVLALAARVRWPGTVAQWFHAAVAGVLLHAIYLGGVWWAVAHGLPAGISALLAAIQPLLTAVLAWPLLGERISRLNAIGVLTGFAGVMLVLAPRFTGIGAGTFGPLLLPIAVNVFGMVGVTLGTFYQKRYGATGDLRSITAVQYLGALAVTVPLLPFIEPQMHIPWTSGSFYALAWSVLVLSVGAIFLMLEMIRRGKVSQVATLLYLVPPTAALQTWLLFEETLSAVQIAGMVVAALGVYLATRR